MPTSFPKEVPAMKLRLVRTPAFHFQLICPKLLLALTLGAGVQWKEAYAAAEDHQRFVVGGISTRMSVGAAGGWIMGGGHSLLSPKYGLGQWA